MAVTTQYLIVGVLVVLIVWVAWTYNRFVRDRNHLREAWSGVDVQLKRRHDLVTTLVQVVRGYSQHERTLLREVTRARRESLRAEDPGERAGAESILSARISGVLGLAEDYPELKADTNFRQLQRTLVEVEDHLQHARRYYNGTARRFNIRRESFPSMLVAWCLGLDEAEYFELTLATERDVPEVAL